MKWLEYWKKERTWLLFLLIFGLIFFRYCYFGFQYFPQLDDYIQMHNQSSYYTAEQVILDMGLLASRPLASLGDYFLWSHFWPCMLVLVGLLSGLYAGSALLFRRVWGTYFGTGYLFLTVYALLPLGMEGTYWVSASTRVIPSLFFTALSMRFFQKWRGGGKWPTLVVYFVTQLISFSFYEQGLILCVTGVLLIALLEFRAAGWRSLSALLTFLNVAIYFAITTYFSTTTGQLGSRMQLTLPWQEGWGAVAQAAATQVGEAYVVGGIMTTVRGFFRGVGTIFSNFNLIWVVVLLLLCALLFFAAKQYTGPTSNLPGALLVGALFAVAPITLFFVLTQPSIGLRNTVFSFCGIAMMLDALAGFLLRKLPLRGVLTGGLCALLAFLFCVASVSELADYRQTYLDDQRAGAAVRTALEEGGGVPVGSRVAVKNLQGSYLAEQNFLHQQHIHGATESAWAFTGLLACESGNRNFPYVTPIPPGVEFDRSQYKVVLIYDPVIGVATPE